MSITFEGRSFCFTGALIDLKRSAAQREVRARGGLTLDRVNERLDYLVVGAKASPGWKHGAYGRKIEAAREMTGRCGRPLLLGEPTFMDALAETPPTNSGAIDSKVVVVTYKFLTPDPPSFDQDVLEHVLTDLQRTSAHVCVRGFPIIAYRELFGMAEPVSGDHLAVEIRIVRQTPLGFDAADWSQTVERLMEAVPEIDGTARWFERAEGSADYIRLLGEVPQSIRLVQA